MRCYFTTQTNGHGMFLHKHLFKVPTSGQVKELQCIILCFSQQTMAGIHFVGGVFACHILSWIQRCSFKKSPAYTFLCTTEGDD